MASFGSFLRGIGYQLNPFDRGKTYSTSFEEEKRRRAQQLLQGSRAAEALRVDVARPNQNVKVQPSREAPRIRVTNLSGGPVTPALPAQITSKQLQQDTAKNQSLFTQIKRFGLPSFGRAVKDTTVTVGRETAKIPETAGRSFIQFQTGTPMSAPAPRDPIRKFLYGNAPLETYQQRGKGVQKETGIPGPLVAIGLAGSDLIPLPGGKGTASLKALAQASTPRAIKRLVGKNISDDVAQVLANTQDPNLIKSVLDVEFKKPATRIKLPEERASVKKLEIGTDAFGPIDKKRVTKYADDIKSGKKIEPILVTKQGGKLFVQDGKHRLLAAEKTGLQDVPIKLKESRKSLTSPNEPDIAPLVKALSPDERLELDAVAKQLGVNDLDGLLSLPKPRGASNITEAAPTPITGNPKKNPLVKEVLTKISQTRTAANTEADLTANIIKTAAKEEGVKLNRKFIDRYQAGQLTTNAEKRVAEIIKRETDRIFSQQQQIDPTIGYRQNYLPQSYAQNTPDVESALSQLRLRTGAVNERQFSTYQEAGQFGLSPKYKTVDQMVGANAQEARQALGNRDVVESGLQSGLFTTGTPQRGQTAVEGFKDEFGAPIFADKKVADVINGVMQDSTTGLAKLLRKSKELNSLWQDIALAGGIPGTPINFFTFGQAVKDLSAGRVSVVKDFMYSLSKQATQRRFAENSDFVREMANRGVPFNVASNLTNAETNPLSKLWGRAVNQPTFQQFMPNQYLSVAENTFNKLNKKVGREKALEIAAETTKKFYGITDQIAKGRDRATQDAIGSLFFAPRYREAVINTLFNTAKSVSPSNLRDPAYAMNRRLLAGIAVTAAGYDRLNRQLNGHGMLDNREGQELSLQIPYGDKDKKGNQPVVNVPFLPGFMTIPRAVFNSATAAFRGDTGGVVAEGSKTLSMPLKVGGEVIGNRDYFGRPIRVDQKVAEEEGVEPDTFAQGAGKIGAYLAGQATPAWVRAGINQAQGKPIEQVIAQGLEAPLRFGKVLNPETEAYFKTREDFVKGLNKNERNIFNQLHPEKKDVRGTNIKDTNKLTKASSYADLIANPDFASKYQAFQQSLNNHDPLWDLNPNQVRSYMQAQLISKNDPGGDPTTVRKLYERLPEDFFSKREEFFAGLKAQGVDVGSSDYKPRPKMPPELQAFSDNYHLLPYGTGQRSAALRSPLGKAYIAYLDQNRIYNNEERADLGLPPLEDPNSKYGSRFGNRDRAGKSAPKLSNYLASIARGGFGETPQIRFKGAKTVKIPSAGPGRRLNISSLTLPSRVPKFK